MKETEEQVTESDAKDITDKCYDLNQTYKHSDYPR